MDKSVLITGGSRGIGAAAVRAYAKLGYTVAFFYKSSHVQAKALALETGARAFCVDLASHARIKEAFSELPGVDILINNAGVADYGLFTELTEERLNEILNVNIKGAVFCAQEASRYMIGKGTGVIINVSSIWGITGASCEVAYSMSKAAMIGLTKALAKELAPSGVRVNCVAPGIIQTDMLSGFTAGELDALKDLTPLGRIGAPEDIVAAMLYLSSDEAGFVTGQTLSPNGGFVI